MLHGSIASSQLTVRSTHFYYHNSPCHPVMLRGSIASNYGVLSLVFLISSAYVASCDMRFQTQLASMSVARDMQNGFPFIR